MQVRASLTARTVVDVPRDLGGRRDRYAAPEDRLLAVNDRHVGQRQLEDGRHQRQRRDVAPVGTMELRTEPTHDGVLAHDMSLNVRPSDERLRRVSGRRDGELDIGQRAGRCRFYLANAVHSRFESAPLDDGRLEGRLNAEPLLESGILKFLSPKRNALCVALSFESLSAFTVTDRYGKEPSLLPSVFISRCRESRILHQLLPRLLARAEVTEEISSKVDAREKRNTTRKSPVKLYKFIFDTALAQHIVQIFRVTK